MAHVMTDTASLLEQMTAGADKAAGLLAPNYGPNGRNTVYDQKYDIPLIINTGKKILSDLQLTDRTENLGTVLLRDAALKMDQTEGDGTIATAIMAGRIIQEGQKLIASGASPVQLRQGIRKGIPAVEKAIRRMTLPAVSRDIIEKTASIAADSEELGRLVADAFDAAGPEGSIAVTDSQEAANRLEISNGIKYEYGYLSSAFINIPEKRRAVLEKPYILLVNKKIRAFSELEHILHEIIDRQVPLLIIAEDMEEAVTASLAANVSRKVFRVVAANGPGHGDTRRRNMQAVAAKTGGIVIEENCGLELKDCGLEVCGQADYICVDRETTLITGLHHADEEKVAVLKKNVNTALETETADYEIEKLNLTKSILAGKMVTVIAGGITEYEMFENQHQIENAVSAVYAATRAGVTVGGGKAYLLALPVIEQMMEQCTKEDRLGLLCIRQALTAPVHQIAENAGDNGAYVLSVLLEHPDRPFWGYDAASHTFGDLREKGILDPVETVCLSFRIAAEIAASILTVSAAVIAEK